MKPVAWGAFGLPEHVWKTYNADDVEYEDGDGWTYP